jgi:uncharacterized membrane protein YvlD (DUF360 family)
VAHWGRASKALGHAVLIWLVATVTLVLVAPLIPGMRLGEAGRGPFGWLVAAGAAAGTFGVLSALVWPWLVRAMLLVPSMVLASLVFVLNGGLVLLALHLVPRDYGTLDLPSAVMVAAALSTAISATHGALAARDDEAYRRRLARIAGRRVRRRDHAGTVAGEPPPALVFLQLDGVSQDVLRQALQDGYLPTVSRWLAGGSHRLTGWRTDWSSQTGASQLAILHGSNHDVPAFRWYEKDTGRLMVCGRPSTAAELERRHGGRPGLLARGGASRGNLFTGGASHAALVLSVSGRASRRDRTGYFAYFSDPASATRTMFSFVAEVARELLASARQRLRNQRPRVRRGGLYPLVRAFATVVARDVVVAAVMGDMLAGRAVVYADLIGYDEVAHHSGVAHAETLEVLRRLDRRVAMIADVARYAPRRYELVLLSDHGQSPSEPFSARFGLTVADLVRSGLSRPELSGPGLSGSELSGSGPAGLGGPGSAGLAALPAWSGRVGPGRHGVGFDDPTVDTGRGAEARLAFPPAQRRAEPVPQRPAGEPIVLASGNLALVSFPDVAHRLTAAEVRQRHPGLIERLAGHPGIGFVLVRDGTRGPLAIGAGGTHELATGRVHGSDPLAAFGPGAAAAVLRTDRFPHCPDLMINSSYCPATGQVLSFEEQIGTHGGLGGEQNRAFLLYPAHLPAPQAPLTGAEAVHRLFAGWLEHLQPSEALTAGRRGHCGE